MTGANSTDSAIPERAAGAARRARSLRRAQCSPLFPASARLCPDGIWDFDLDLEDRNFVAAVHLHSDTVWIDFDVPAHNSEDFLTQGEEKFGRTLALGLIGEQDLQAIARHRSRRASTLEEVEQVHAALAQTACQTESVCPSE